MISFWHLTAVCCVPMLNPDRRVREQAIFRDVANDQARQPTRDSAQRVRGRWERRALKLAGKA